MKKYLFITLCALAIVGCTPQRITNVTEVTEVVNASTTASYIYQVDAWTYTDFVDGSGPPYANNFFYARANFPELTADLYKKANIQVYRVHDEYQHILPEVQHREEQLSDGTWNFYTQTVDAVFGPGWIEFDVTHSDFQYEQDVTYVPEVMKFRVVLTW